MALQWERVGDGFVVKKRGWNIAYKVKEIKIRRRISNEIKEKGSGQIQISPPAILQWFSLRAVKF